MHIKQAVIEANQALPKAGLVTFTWGNVSGIDRETGLVYIKPSGVDYAALMEEDIVTLDLDGNVVEGKLRPSTDTATHIALYRAFPTIGAVVHTHSLYATIFSQAGEGIMPYGTTHADYFNGTIPVTRQLSMRDTAGDYEANTGAVIVETIGNADPLDIPACLVHNHGPFVWGATLTDAVHNAIVLEEVAHMAYCTLQLNEHTPKMPNHLLERHFHRKHGASAYYGNSN